MTSRPDRWNIRIIYDWFHIMIIILAIANMDISDMRGEKCSDWSSDYAGMMLILALAIQNFGGGDIKLMAVSGLFL